MNSFKTRQPIPPALFVRLVDKLRGLLQAVRVNLVPPPVALLEMFCGHWISQALFVAAQFQLADHLSTGPKSLKELALLSGTDEGALFRLMRALCSVGVFRELKNKQFELTRISQPLRQDSPESVYAMARMMGSSVHWDTWRELGAAVRTGLSPFERLHGKPMFEFLKANPEAAMYFDEAMTSMSKLSALCVAAAYDFSRLKRVVDVGGGQGFLLSTLVSRFEGLSGILFDLEAVVQGAAKTFSKLGVSERCQVQAGSFFDTIPAGADGYLARNVIHDWDDEAAIKILKNIRRAMGQESRLFLVESVIPEGNQPFFGKFLDLEMLTMTSGGRERTQVEYAALFKAAGFSLQEVVPTASLESILIGGLA